MNRWNQRKNGKNTNSSTTVDARYAEYEELKRPYKNGHDHPQEPLPIRAFHEIIYDPYSDVWLIEDLLWTEEISLIFGPPNVGKTFFGLGMSLAVADINTTTWFGRKLHHGNVVYLASEGGRRIDKRIAAWKSHNLYDKNTRLPFWLITEPLDLCHRDTDTKRTIATVRNQIGSEPLSLLTIETVNSVLNGGDENGPEDMGAVIGNARRLRDEFECHVQLIHHPPQTARTSRGHNSLPAAVDTEILIDKNDPTQPATVTLLKQREAEKAAPFPFELKVIQLGENRDGKSISSCVVVPRLGGSSASDAP